MRLFSWLKKKQKEEDRFEPHNEPITTLDIDKATKDFEKSLDEFVEEQPKEPQIKFKAILSNKVLTVFLPGGDIITNTDATPELFVQVRDAKTEGKIRELMLSIEVTPPEKEKLDEVFYNEDIKEAIPEIVATGDFNEVGGVLYMNGIDVSIPKLLAKEILNAGSNNTSEYYDSLKSFWCWCVLNPDNVAREDLFGFLERGDFKITKNGFFLGYRSVVKREAKDKQSKALVQFISDKYLNIKMKQKKSPKNFTVVELKDGVLNVIHDKAIPQLKKEDNVIGNLADLYNGLDEMEDNDYTDNHTHTMTIKIGTPVKMARESCDNDPHSDCSRGLHIGNKRFGYSGNGDTTILVAVNPMNVVAVPNHNANKMRVCEYMPLGLVDNSKDWLEDVDSLSIESEYANSEIKDLHRLAVASDSKETKTKLLMGGGKLIEQVTLKLEDYQSAIVQRVTKIK